MIEVYIWYPIAGKSFGHFALKITNDSLTQPTYISFWPIRRYMVEDAISMVSVPSMWNDISGRDRSIEGRTQDQVILIRNPNVNEQRILQSWQEWQDSEFNPLNNCATMTLRLLEAGGLTDSDRDYVNVRRKIFDAMETIGYNMKTLVPNQ